MRRDHRPYWLKKLYERIESGWVRHMLAPQFDACGRHLRIMKPWNVRVHGRGIEIGDCVHMVAARDRTIGLSSWEHADGHGRIEIEDYSLVCPGVRIDSASRVRIGSGSMLAAGVYVTDADWHDLADRTRPIGSTRPVILEEDTWIGDGAVICKGVTVGHHSIVGAGAVVTRDVPPDTIVAGNPARVVRQLDPASPPRGRRALFEQREETEAFFDGLDRAFLAENSLAGWLRANLAPRRDD